MVYSLVSHQFHTTVQFTPARHTCQYVHIGRSPFHGCVNQCSSHRDVNIPTLIATPQQRGHTLAQAKAWTRNLLISSRAWPTLYRSKLSDSLTTRPLRRGYPVALKQFCLSACLIHVTILCFPPLHHWGVDDHCNVSHACSPTPSGLCAESLFIMVSL